VLGAGRCENPRKRHSVSLFALFATLAVRGVRACQPNPHCSLFVVRGFKLWLHCSLVVFVCEQPGARAGQTVVPKVFVTNRTTRTV